MSTSGPFACLDCGRQVVWTTSRKTGKRYLASIKRWMGEDTFAERVYYPSHRCTPDGLRAEREQAKAERLAQAAAEGIVEKGMTVEVVKGRKVPKGTTGVVIWIGDGAYGERVGIKDAAGETHWTALDNVAPRVDREA